MRIFEPYKLAGKLSLPNRIVLPAVVTRLATDDGHVTQALIDRYRIYAAGGTGLVIIEAVSVARQKSGQLLRLNDDEYIAGLRWLTDAVHAETDAKIAPQILHFLKKSRSGYRQKVEDLTLEEIKELPGMFASAAYRARQAGFDAVELHYAHAYTMSSFLSRHNHRTDEYGGSLEKRLRLAVEVIEATRAAVGGDFVLGCRLNGDEFTMGGNSLAQSRAIALRVAELGLDYVSVSAGGKFEDGVEREGESLDPYTGYSGSRAMPPRYMPEKVNVYLAADIRRTLRAAGHETTVIAAGRIPSAAVAESVLLEGEADLVAIARPTICDPHWPRKSHEGREVDILRCTYCNECREAEGRYEDVVCRQWKRRDGSLAPPTLAGKGPASVPAGSEGA